MSNNNNRYLKSFNAALHVADHLQYFVIDADPTYQYRLKTIKFSLGAILLPNVRFYTPIRVTLRRGMQCNTCCV